MHAFAARSGRWIGRGVLLFAAGVFVLLALGPHTGRYRTLTVLTASMRPALPQGSVVVVVPARVSNLAVGDVITYSIPVEDHRVITHRVAEIVEPGVVRTKGDANNAVDPWVARLAGPTVWKVRGNIPGVGYAIRALGRPGIGLSSVFGALGVAVILCLRSIWRRPVSA